METGRVVDGRYHVQRLIQQGRFSTVYQGFDKELQRPVTVKMIAAPYIQDYHEAIRLTSQFSHPNIVGIYDLITTPDMLAVVQEYVEGNDFGQLLAMQIPPYQVCDLGTQVCLALLYASNAPRPTSHGDLTPNAILRDRRGLVRVNNFALPGDVDYFTAWQVLGRDATPYMPPQPPYGQLNEQQREADTRATGLLLYQLLAGRTPGATRVEPPPDGTLYFQRNVPGTLCEIVARAVIRQHPNHIMTAEQLYLELKTLLEQLEPETEVVAAGAMGGYQAAESVSPKQFMPGMPVGSSKLATALPVQEVEQAGIAVAPSPVDPLPVAPTMADVSLKLASTRQAVYAAQSQQPLTEPERQAGFPYIWLIAGIIAFVLFFIVGYFIATSVFH